MIIRISNLNEAFFKKSSNKKSEKIENKKESYEGTFTRVDVTASSKSIFDTLYNHEALTAEGISIKDDSDLEKINKWFRENSKCTAKNINIYIITGKAMNDFYHLTGDNKYPNSNYHIVCIDWSAANCKEPYKGSWRWFSDVVDNNAKREIVKGNKHYNHYNSKYYGNIGIED